MPKVLAGWDHSNMTIAPEALMQRKHRLTEHADF
jgi:hypothetical protein